MLCRGHFGPISLGSIDELLNSALFPETHAKKIGFAFGFYSEPTLNFGLARVIIASLFLGCLLAWLAWRADLHRDIASSFILLMTASYIFPIMSECLSFDSQRLLISLLSVLLIFTLVRPVRDCVALDRAKSDLMTKLIANIPSEKVR